MISLLTPWIFVASVVAAGVVTALHFLSVHRPPVWLLPTTRFLVPGDARAISRSRTPSDLLLLAMRVAALLLMGLALAGPSWRSNGDRIGHIVIADEAWRSDSARVLEIVGVPSGASGVTRVVWLTGDSASRGVGGASRRAPVDVRTDSSIARVGGMHRALAAAFPAAWRATDRLMRERPTLDSVALDILAPPSSASVDGWESWRASWPGRVTVRTPIDTTQASDRAATGAVAGTGSDALLRASELSRAAVTVSGGPPDDVVAAAIALHGHALGVRVDGARGAVRPGEQAGETTIRIARQPVGTAADDPRGGSLARSSTSATSTSSSLTSLAQSSRTSVADSEQRATIAANAGRSNPTTIVTIEWPVDGRPRGWSARNDSVGAIAERGVALVAPWRRNAAAPRAAGWRTIAWWGDGDAAAVERLQNGECVKQVGIAVPNGSDLLLAPGARALLEAIVAPCGAGMLGIPPSILDTTTVTPLASVAALKRTTGVRRIATRGWLPMVLLLAAIALLLAEWVVRTSMAGERALAGTGSRTAGPRAVRERAA